jgi:hypothetical protein
LKSDDIRNTGMKIYSAMNFFDSGGGANSKGMYGMRKDTFKRKSRDSFILEVFGKQNLPSGGTVRYSAQINTQNITKLIFRFLTKNKPSRL